MQPRLAWGVKGMSIQPGLFSDLALLPKRWTYTETDLHLQVKFMEQALYPLSYIPRLYSVARLAWNSLCTSGWP